MLVAGVVLGELAVISLVFQLALDFDCRASDSLATCLFVRSLVVRALTLAAALVLFVPARLTDFNALWRPSTDPPHPWPALQLLGFLLILAPALLAGPDFAGSFRLGLVPWTAGAILASAGALFWLASPSAWRSFLQGPGAPILLVVGAGLVAPDLVGQANRLWTWNPLTDVTFAATVHLLSLFGTIEVDASRSLIGLDEFLVEVADPCSGIEGFALITGLLVGYLVLYRKELRLARAWLLIPIGLAASFCLNVVRIALLLWVGARVSPGLALNGFHSYAGWLMFTLLAFALIGLSRTVPWFRATTAAASLPPLTRDPQAALILPFIGMMLSSLVLATVTEKPELFYPLRAAAMLAALLPFLPWYRQLVWRPDALACAAGVLVGLAWIATGTNPASQASALDVLSRPAFALWLAARLLGATLLVPVIEEAFFRGYLLRRLDRGGLARPLALLASAGLFALLHERWVAAFASGVVFGLLMLRRGRLVDAIAAHAIANAMIAACAFARGDWTLT